MDKITSLISESPFGESPVMPEMIEGTTTIQFQCRKGIDCWNACCSNIDISLTPVDILRLSRRLGISTTEFQRRFFQGFANFNAAAEVKRFREVFGYVWQYGEAEPELQVLHI